jgi:hypothetical protein
MSIHDRLAEMDRECRYLEADLAEMRWLDQQHKEAKRPERPTLPPLVAKPGSHWAAAAFKAGREDEYINDMQARYGGDW